MGDRPNARYWIEKLRLSPHPEGGYFRETYRADSIIPASALPSFGGARSASTAIYFLLEGENFSGFHRILSDEMWHFYGGSTLAVHQIAPSGEHSSILLGSDPDAGEVFQAVVPAGYWFASQVADRHGWSLVACTVAPGFDFADFEMARREDLVARYPQHSDLIRRLTRD
jgi:predicted cupin superfamily sugar epimerase